MTATLIILALSAILFVSGKLRSDLVAVCSALALVLSGVLTPEEALTGFSNPIVIMMVGLFIVGGGIFSTGLAKRIGTGILGLAGTNETRLFFLFMLTTAVVGAFVSNTGTVALMLPIVVSMARGAGLSPSRFLMPLAFAGSMGGMLTLIGTPPNLIVRDALASAGYEPLGFFSFTPIGIVCIVVGTALLIPLSRRFLKGRSASASSKSGKSLQQLVEEYKLAEGLHCLQISESSAMVAQAARCAAQLRSNCNRSAPFLSSRRSLAQARTVCHRQSSALCGRRALCYRLSRANKVFCQRAATQRTGGLSSRWRTA